MASKVVLVGDAEEGVQQAAVAEYTFGARTWRLLMLANHGCSWRMTRASLRAPR